MAAQSSGVSVTPQKEVLFGKICWLQITLLCIHTFLQLKDPIKDCCTVFPSAINKTNELLYLTHSMFQYSFGYRKFYFVLTSLTGGASVSWCTLTDSIIWRAWCPIFAVTRQWAIWSPLSLSAHTVTVYTCNHKQDCQHKNIKRLSAQLF